MSPSVLYIPSVELPDIAELILSGYYARAGSLAQLVRASDS